MRFSGYYNAKLLLTGEYLVLHGARALALPLRFGQSIEVAEADHRYLHWQAIGSAGKIWFAAKFSPDNFTVTEATDEKIAGRLSHILKAAGELNPAFCEQQQGHVVVTRLNYPAEWGLGSSSTLLAGIAGWAGVNPFELHFRVSEGSGYDIACAIYKKPVLYKLNERTPEIEETRFFPLFSQHIFFMYLGRKQDSAQSVKKFMQQAQNISEPVISKASMLSRQMLQADTLDRFENVMAEHERLISSITGLPSIRQTLFHDLDGEAKSLGAWGGDFCMVTWRQSREELAKYLKAKGLEVFFSFDEMVLK